MKKFIPAFAFAFIAIGAVFHLIPLHAQLSGTAAVLPASGATTTQDGQSATAAPTLAFEVVSIKPNNSGPQTGWGYRETNDGIYGKNMPLWMLLQYAFGVFEPYRLLGAPKWVMTENYDFEAKYTEATADSLKHMTPDKRTAARYELIHSALEERCHLQSHAETKEMPVYLLVVTDSGPKFHESTATDVGPNGVWGGRGVRNGAVTWDAKHVPLSQLAGRLSSELAENRLVIDQTGLAGHYDFILSFADPRSIAPAPSDAGSVPTASDPTGVSIFTALQDQLGLKLKPSKGPVQVIVIDHLEHPGPN
ncbi:MAG TPA: TIGR03435 family protein [Candidatus Acidoferrales bacterium]|nr:TIGR03435 family protein [Candidatus Acidoferrales bacterium]